MKVLKWEAPLSFQLNKTRECPSSYREAKGQFPVDLSSPSELEGGQLNQSMSSLAWKS